MGSMSAELAIHIEDLSKQYRRGTATDTLRDLVSSACHRLFRAREPLQVDPRVFWALKDVCLDITQGEVVGIIGRNGAGKSTLLKILARITAPTGGRAEVRGRVGSLLEVGTGFEPELTGRENIFLNGAILGMRRSEIHRQLDDIIAWSGVSAFIDTPVKRYSSGMRVRLAFAVAAHLDPEILIVDEVLAVGDAEFQRKCLSKMNDVARDGRTVLFVSHNMTATLNLCRRAVVLEAGRVVFDGAISDAVANYTSRLARQTGGYVDLRGECARAPGMRPIIRGIGLRRVDRTQHTANFKTGDDVALDIHYDCGASSVDVVQVTISTTAGERLVTLGSHLSPGAPDTISGRGVATCVARHLPLTQGEYDVSVTMSNRIPWHDVDCVDPALRIEVENDDYFGTGLRPGTEQGPIAHRSEWSLVPAVEKHTRRARFAHAEAVGS
jgi:homopolymeric O-antigen transport system ATP-binding protein